MAVARPSGIEPVEPAVEADVPKHLDALFVLPSNAPKPPGGSEDGPKRIRPPPRQGKARSANPPEVLVTPCSGPWPPNYIIKDGLRRVEPYHFTYHTNCKGRWRGQRIFDVFADEFRDRPQEYYRQALVEGRVAVNGETVGPDYLLRNGDVVSHQTHRHEPPVTSDPIDVLHEDEDMTVLVKPSGLPVHPAGRYFYNTVAEIMRTQRGSQFVPYICIRLDRLTSGIMFVAKNASAADRLARKLSERGVRKEYVARVVGEFPPGIVSCDQPILSISPKVTLNRVRATGKPARTVFRRLAYYPPAGGLAASGMAAGQAPAAEQTRKPGGVGYSIVRCMPVTGRTHQIRVHLQFLGYPIANDPIYANRRVWGFDLGKADEGGGLSDEDIISRLDRMGKDQVAEAVAYHDEMTDDYHRRQAERLNGLECDVCGTALYSDPGMQELRLWLHSLRYEDADGAWSYTTPLPKWAMPPEDVEGPTEVGTFADFGPSEDPFAAGR